MGVAQEDHDALLVEVQRLEAELGRVRQDLQGVLGCKGKCGQLDTLQQTVRNTDINSCLGFGVISTVLIRFVLPSQISDQVSSQVRKELQALFFGGVGAGDEQREVPESLVHWLSQRYVSTPDLQALLASLEMSILRNVSLQLELSRAQTLGEAESQAKTIVKTVTGTVQHTASTEGMTEEVINVHFCCQHHRHVDY